MADYKTYPITVAVAPEGKNPIFEEGVYHVSVEDEAAGPFLKIKDISGHCGEKDTITIDFEAFDAIYEEVQKLKKAYEELD